MLNMLKNMIAPKDFFDLDASLQVSGLSVDESANLCKLLEYYGRSKLQVRKTIAQIFNRQKAKIEDVRYLLEEVPFILKPNTRELLSNATSQDELFGILKANLAI